MNEHTPDCFAVNISGTPLLFPVRNTGTDKNDKPTGSKRLKREHGRSVKRR